MLKKFAKQVIADVVTRLPWGAREAMIEALISQAGSYKTMMRLASHNNVTGFVVEGQYGSILGSSADNAILAYYATHGVWAKHTNRAAFDALESGGTFLDIGANIGLTVKPLLTIPNIVIHAFEPEPKNLSILRSNLAGHENVTIHPIALFNRETTLEFEIATDNLGDHRIHVTDAPGVNKEELRDVIHVRASRLDDVLPEIHGKLVVKIDTQGADPFVIQGGQKTLSKADVVFVEFWPYGMARMNADHSVLLDFIAEFDRAELSLDYSERDKEIVSIDEVLKRVTALDPANRRDEIDITLYR